MSDESREKHPGKAGKTAAHEEERPERGAAAKESANIKVTDRRMFTAEGELREEYRFLEEKAKAAASAPPPPRRETPEPKREARVNPEPAPAGGGRIPARTRQIRRWRSSPRSPS